MSQASVGGDVFVECDTPNKSGKASIATMSSNSKPNVHRGPDDEMKSLHNMFAFFDKYKNCGGAALTTDLSTDSDFEISDPEDLDDLNLPPRPKRMSRSSRRSSLAFSLRQSLSRRSSMYEIGRVLRQFFDDDKEEEETNVEIPFDMDKMSTEELIGKFYEVQHEVEQIEEKYPVAFVAATELDLQRLLKLLKEKAEDEPVAGGKKARVLSEGEEQLINNAKTIAATAKRIKEKLDRFQSLSDSLKLVNSVL